MSKRARLQKSAVSKKPRLTWVQKIPVHRLSFGDALKISKKTGIASDDVIKVIREVLRFTSQKKRVVVGSA